MRCLYKTRPYEAVKSSANALHEKWRKIAIDSLVDSKSKYGYGDVCRGIVNDFDNLRLNEDLKKPRVGIVGEILVKYMPLANNRLVDLLENEGAEAVVPDLMDFLNYSVYNGIYKHKFLGTSFASSAVAKLCVRAIRLLRSPAIKALKNSKRLEPPIKIEQIAQNAKPIISLGNQYGQGWI